MTEMKPTLREDTFTQPTTVVTSLWFFKGVFLKYSNKKYLASFKWISMYALHGDLINCDTFVLVKNIWYLYCYLYSLECQFSKWLPQGKIVSEFQKSIFCLDWRLSRWFFLREWCTVVYLLAYMNRKFVCLLLFQFQCQQSRWVGGGKELTRGKTEAFCRYLKVD